MWLVMGLNSYTADLRVLLILRVEVVDGILHYVFGVHRLNPYNMPNWIKVWRILGAGPPSESCLCFVESSAPLVHHCLHFGILPCLYL